MSFRKLNRNLFAGFIVVFLLVAVAELSPLAAQTTANILGTVKDQSGAVLPGATITATSVETGISRSAVSGSRGEYRLQALGLGDYEIQTNMTGFQTEVRKGVTLTLGREAVVDFTLLVGSVTEQVTVTGEAPLIETTTATVSGLVDPKQMREIPLNARSFIELVPLQAGAVYAESGETSATKGFGVKLAITGTRYNGNAFLLDGANINDAANSSGSAAGTMAGVETVREFKVITNAYDAEYGQHVGGVVSAVTKSGTNEFHGAVFEFLRNDKLDAPDFDDNRLAAGEKPAYRRNQFGGNLGGPIRKNSTFFFGSLELLREAVGSRLSSNVPGPELRAGCVPQTSGSGAAARRTEVRCYKADGTFDTYAPDAVPANAGFVNPRTRPFMDTYPQANTPCSTGCFAGNSFWNANGQGNFTRAQSIITNQDFWTARVDQRLSDSDNFFVRYTNDIADRTEPGFDTAEISGTKNRYATIEHTHIYSPALLGRTNFSFVRTALALYDRSLKSLGLADYEIPACPSCTEHTDSFTGNDVPGALSTGVGAGWGGSNTNPKQHNLNTFQFQEGITYSVGRQNLKMGGNFQRNQFNQRSDFYPGGSYSFSAPEDFITNTVGGFNVTTPGSDNIRGWRQNIMGLYLQDDVMLSSRLTLNLGLRYEIISVPTEVNGKIATIRDQSDSFFYSFREDQTDVGDPYFTNPSLKNFAPRIGIAWQPFANGKTAIRAGGGIFHDQLTSNFYITSGVRVAPFYSVAVLNDREFRQNTGQSIDFPNAIRTQTNLLRGGALPQIDGFQWDVEQPTTYKFSFTIQQQLLSDTTLEVGYSGTRGVHNVRGNMLQNTTPVNYVPALGGGQFIFLEQNRPNPNWERMRWRYTDGTSWYHGLLVTATKRYSRGFQIGSSYTYSKSLDDSSTWTGSTDFGAGDTLGVRKEHWRGRSAFDVSHSWATSFVWDLPGSRLNGIAGKLLGGWNLGGILRAFSGNPTTLTASRPALGRLGNLGITGNSGTSNCSAAQTAAGCLRYSASFVAGSSVSLAPGLDKAKINPGSREQYFDPADLIWPQNFVNNAALLLNYPGAGPNASRPGALVGMGNIGRNTITVPGLVNFDLTIRKDTMMPMLGEAGKMEFRAEFFNAANHPRLGLPGRSLFDTQGRPSATAGVITDARGNPRQLQLSLRLVF
ncbi:MAG: TonB-dependent receptor [Acidobacteria bacterium]|nr:TonB-dependent receptor [Acidobacteriota bacterium]